jgi:hypothetical protein
VTACPKLSAAEHPGPSGRLGTATAESRRWRSRLRSGLNDRSKLWWDWGTVGEEYRDTPHNVGQRVVELLARSLGGEWRQIAQAMVSQVGVPGQNGVSRQAADAGQCQRSGCAATWFSTWIRTGRVHFWSMTISIFHSARCVRACGGAAMGVTAVSALSCRPFELTRCAE